VSLLLPVPELETPSVLSFVQTKHPILLETRFGREAPEYVSEETAASFRLKLNVKLPFSLTVMKLAKRR
jgi:hypothetical protein